MSSTRAVVLAAGVLLACQSGERRPAAGDPVGETAAAPAGGAAARAGSDSGGQFSPSPGQPPPVRRQNKLGQPINESGAPLGPADKLDALSEAFPSTPPAIADVAARKRYKAWWVGELAGRIADLRRRQGLTPAGDVTALLDAYFDAAEPRREGESLERALERRERWRSLRARFIAEVGVSPVQLAHAGGSTDPAPGPPTPAPATP